MAVMESVLSDSQRSTLAAACDTFVPAVESDTHDPLEKEFMARSAGEELDAGAVRDTVERALAGMEDVRKVKNQLTGAKTSIDKARDMVEGMAAQVRAHLAEIDSLVLRAAATDDDQASLGDPG